MDFKQLMNLASQNKSRAEKQKDTKEVIPRHSNGGSKEGVSQAAVQAFLAKREMEKKKKAAEEKAARQARIEERLAQSLGVKRTESSKVTKGGVSSQEGQKKPSKTDVINGKQSTRILNEKQKNSDQRASKKLQVSSSKNTDRDRTRPSREADGKNGVTKSKSSSAKKGAPLSFKDLLAAAERNKNGSALLKSSVQNVSSVKKKESDKESNHVKKESLEDKFTNPAQDKRTKHPKTVPTRDSKTSSKLATNDSRVKVKPSSSTQSLRMKEKQDSKQSLGLLSRSKEHLVSKKNSTIAPIPSNSKHVSPSVERQLVKERQLYHQKERMLLKRKRNPYMDEMDDFIDDEDVDDPADVSKYIKEIFGYDRSRFNDEDDDLSYMESSYSQIEKEENKSAKIARLEDEIEQLKELAELKEMRDKLKKKSKK